jgi:hypothetical protein
VSHYSAGLNCASKPVRIKVNQIQFKEGPKPLRLWFKEESERERERERALAPQFKRGSQQPDTKEG